MGRKIILIIGLLIAFGTLVQSTARADVFVGYPFPISPHNEPYALPSLDASQDIVVWTRRTGNMEAEVWAYEISKNEAFPIIQDHKSNEKVSTDGEWVVWSTSYSTGNFFDPIRSEVVAKNLVSDEIKQLWDTNVEYWPITSTDHGYVVWETSSNGEHILYDLAADDTTNLPPAPRMKIEYPYVIWLEEEILPEDPDHIQENVMVFDIEIGSTYKINSFVHDIDYVIGDWDVSGDNLTWAYPDYDAQLFFVKVYNFQTGEEYGHQCEALCKNPRIDENWVMYEWMRTTNFVDGGGYAAWNFITDEHKIVKEYSQFSGGLHEILGTMVIWDDWYTTKNIYVFLGALLYPQHLFLPSITRQ